MAIIDKLGWGPKRVVTKTNQGWLVKVTPNPMSGSDKEQYVHLTEQQKRGYDDWQADRGLIQECLPDLTAEEREILISGLNDEEFRRLAEDDRGE